MAVPAVTPCGTSGEVHDALNRITALLADAKDEAESIRLGAADGVAMPDQITQATELRAEALSLAGTLNGVFAAYLASRESASTPAPARLDEAA